VRGTVLSTVLGGPRLRLRRHSRRGFAARGGRSFGFLDLGVRGFGFLDLGVRGYTLLTMHLRISSLLGKSCAGGCILSLAVRKTTSFLALAANGRRGRGRGHD
jgi:hypothetical protein